MRWIRNRDLLLAVYGPWLTVLTAATVWGWPWEW